MNLSIRSRFALTLSITLASLVGLYATSLLIVAQQRFTSELDRRLQFEAYVTGDLIRLSPTDTSQKLQARDVIEAEERDTPERTIDLEVRQGSAVIYRRQQAETSHFLSRIEFDPRAPEDMTHQLDGRRIRVRQLEFHSAGQIWVVRAAADERESVHSLASLRRAVLLGTPVIVALGVLLSYWLAGRALRPLTRIAAEAGTITAANLEQRISVQSTRAQGTALTGHGHVGDEIARLATSFNELLDRLQQAFAELRRFTADASHELRTPLTVMRSLGEMALTSHPPTQNYRDTIGQMLEEVDRLTQLVESLLMLARGEAGGWRVEESEVDLTELVEAVCVQMRVLAEERNQSLIFERSNTPHIMTDSKLVKIAVMNVIHNAVKFTPVGGRIEVRVESNESVIHVDVDDSGPGIPPGDREKVFERFYRSDRARAEPARGFGLGLSISRWALDALDGSVNADQSLLGGARVRIGIPRKLPFQGGHSV